MRHVKILPNGDLFLSGVPCSLACTFCVEGRAKRVEREQLSRSRWASAGAALRMLSLPIGGALRRLERRAPTGGRTLSARQPVDEVLRELDQALARTAADEVVLAAHDVLAFEGLMEALDLCARHAKRVALISPGLQLADPDLARRIAPRIARITLTFLSDDPVTYRRMTGRPDAHRRVRAAVENLVRLAVPLDVNCVVTAQNVHDLQGVAAFVLEKVSLSSLTLVGLLLEERHLELDPGAPDLIAPYPVLDSELRRIVRRYEEGSKRLVLQGVPPCRLSEEVLGSRCLRLGRPGGDDGLARRHWDPGCERCALRSLCPGVFSAYHWRHPAERSDPAVVNRLAPRLLGARRERSGHPA